MWGHIQSYVFCTDSLTLSYDMLYTLLCNMHTLKVLQGRDCNDHKNSCNCTFEVHTLHCYSDVFLPFQIIPTHCLQHVSNTLHNLHTSGPSALCKTPTYRSSWHKTCPFCCWQEINNIYVHMKYKHAILVPPHVWIPPTSTSFTTCTTCHMRALSAHNTQPSD